MYVLQYRFAHNEHTHTCLFPLYLWSWTGAFFFVGCSSAFWPFHLVGIVLARSFSSTDQPASQPNQHNDVITLREKSHSSQPIRIQFNWNLKSGDSVRKTRQDTTAIANFGSFIYKYTVPHTHKRKSRNTRSNQNHIVWSICSFPLLKFYYSIWVIFRGEYRSAMTICGLDMEHQ